MKQEHGHLVHLDMSCGRHELAKGKQDSGVYRCGNCLYCKNKRQTLSGTDAGTCTRKN
jgi:hypothetical protein